MASISSQSLHRIETLTRHHQNFSTCSRSKSHVQASCSGRPQKLSNDSLLPLFEGLRANSIQTKVRAKSCTNIKSGRRGAKLGECIEEEGVREGYTCHRGPVALLGDREKDSGTRLGLDNCDDGKQSSWSAEAVRPEPTFLAVVASNQSGQLNVTARVIYSLLMYGGMALVGKLICDTAGVDFTGAFHFDAGDFYVGLLASLLPIFGSLVLHQDSVVESWAPARAIQDAEDEEIAEFFLGMVPWQYMVVAAAASLAEGIFFRSAVQGSLAHALRMSGGGINETTYGIASITGIIPTFAPFAQASAAVLTAAITGSMFYIISTPKDPKFVVSNGKKSREMRKRVEAWHERQQLKKIYSPLLESLLSLYLGFEWILTGNLLAPMVTHALYYTGTVRCGLNRIEERRVRVLDQTARLPSSNSSSGKTGTGAESGVDAPEQL